MAYLTFFPYISMKNECTEVLRQPACNWSQWLLVAVILEFR